MPDGCGLALRRTRTVAFARGEGRGQYSKRGFLHPTFSEIPLARVWKRFYHSHQQFASIRPGF